MLPNHDDILQAMQEKHEVSVTWPSKDDGGSLQTRRCAPMDYAPARISSEGEYRYHFWDLESDSGKSHNLSLAAAQISSVVILETSFDPASFVTWTTNWTVARTTWGAYN